MRSAPTAGFGGKSAERRLMFAGGNLIAQIVAVELSVARQVMERLPTPYRACCTVIRLTI